MAVAVEEEEEEEGEAVVHGEPSGWWQLGSDESFDGPPPLPPPSVSWLR